MPQIINFNKFYRCLNKFEIVSLRWCWGSVFVIFLYKFFSVKCDVTYSANSSETTDRRLSNAGDAVIFSANLTLDGAGYIYSFPPTYSLSNFLVVNNSVSATITNLMFQHLRPEHVTLGSG